MWPSVRGKFSEHQEGHSYGLRLLWQSFSWCGVGRRGLWDTDGAVSPPALPNGGRATSATLVSRQPSASGRDSAPDALGLCSDGRVANQPAVALPGRAIYSALFVFAINLPGVGLLQQWDYFEQPWQTLQQEFR